MQRRAVFIILTCMLLAFFALPRPALSQKHLFKGTIQNPVQSGIGYEYVHRSRWGIGAQTGLWAPPNHKIVFLGMDLLGANSNLLSLIENSYNWAWVSEINANYHFKKNYLGVFIQFMVFREGEVDRAELEDFYGVSLRDFPRRGPVVEDESTFFLRSRLWQGGIKYGRRYPINRQITVGGEVAVSANIGSFHRLHIPSRDIRILSDTVDENLRENFQNHAFIPSVAFWVTYRIDRQRGPYIPE